MRGPKLGRWLLGLGLLAAGLLGTAQARTVKIISADRLELRKLTGDLLPDGTHAPDQEIVVISGEKVELHIDDDVILATRVEYNRTRRTLTIIGAGEYDTVQNGSSEVLKGSGLVVDLGSEALTGEDVLISDSQLEILGEAVSRVPGQLTATNSYFTACAKCGRTPNDYAFRAKNVRLYPGDRLVAYDATLLLADVPVLFLPVVVLPLQDPDRQPKFNFGQSAVDGFTVQADLPFVIGSSTLGTTLLRFYQNRSPFLGFGVDLKSYSPWPGVDRLNLYALASPKPLTTITNPDGTTTRASGYEINLNFAVRGNLNYSPALTGIDYKFSAVRTDIGRADNDPARGVTDVSGTATADFPDYSVALNYTDRYGPAPTVALPNVLARPEVVFDPKPYRLGNFSADFKVTVGNYTAASNPLSRSAQAQGPNFSTLRLEENHVLGFSAKPWQGATFTLSNTFTGRYYLTGARVVNLNVTANLTQIFSTGNSVALNYVYTRQEGTSPFAFDAVYIRPPSSTLSATVNVTPTPGFSLSASQGYDFFQPSSAQPAANFGVQLQRDPVSASINLAPNFFTGNLETANLNAVVGQNRSFVLGLTAGYTLLSGPGIASLSADAIGGPRTNTFGVTLNYDLKQQLLSSVNLRAAAVATRDTVLNPVSLTANETIVLQTPTQTPTLSGQATLTTGSFQVTSAHNLTLTPAGNPLSDRITFSVGSVAGAALNWSVGYGGLYDIARLGWTKPTVTANLTATRQGQQLRAQASLNVPGLDQSITELGSASIAGNYDLGRAFVSGGAYYTRIRSGTGTATQSVTDTLTFQPLTVTVALGNGPRPGAYISGTLRSALTWQDGVLQAPGRIEPILLFTVDRCCWAFQVEINPVDQRYRIGLSLPGGGTQPAFDVTSSGVSVPLLNPGSGY
ncbi:hypothetical protein MF271_12090 [Deinococcus sp. KNUC1210]|uniref:hypothetical protein n=1 Tax=Deinococcus sp. KNUC1210 TaxID=2917691 RepID=UPI001EF10D22|nr:hypothetical protein [Deinococcus sp. KNUC1210]ULH14735.1 hypothetical protein MF271_12090 [Deinococcus sp. KNUC1210]